ncbi:aryl-alcohol oxidase [Hysterangium stoloniferum]|nr:aryl-alcohol oxidase [Hysterangium stoloniferum]
MPGLVRSLDLLSFAFGFFLLIPPSLCAIYTNIADLPQTNFDFIVIGGGLAGNVIANRLTENAKVSVLVLEAGGSDQGILDVQVPWLSPLLEGSAYDWNYTTIPQPGANNRVIGYSRGFILGGCTSLNRLIYTRGSADDYDRFARVSQDPGWSWDSLQPYIQKTERWVPPADGHDTTGQFDPSVHGFNGINSVSLPGYPQAIDNMVIQTTVELADEFPFNQDINSGNPLGLGWTQLSVGNGQRSSSSTSYLGPQFINRPNLSVLLHAHVTRILPSSTTAGNNPIFQTVEFAQSNKGARHNITVSKEVILSAGSIATPQILMNSGIGDQSELEPLGIQTYVNIPDVGKNLSDQVSMSLTYFANSSQTWDDINRNTTLRNGLIAAWKKTHQGPLVDITNNHLAFVRIPNSDPIFEQNTDPSSGPRAAHFQFRIQVAVSTSGNYFSLGLSMNTPESRGSISLKTSNPFDPPLIDVGLLTTNFDIAAARQCVRTAQRFITAPVWKNYVLGPINTFPNTTTDAELDQYIRAHATQTGHAVGTSSMSPKGANYGVVDPDLVVKGASGLRIIDASVMPFVPCANIQAAVYLIAERGADLVKSTWGI